MIYYFIAALDFRVKTIFVLVMILMSLLINNRYIFCIDLLPLSISFFTIGDLCKDVKLKVFIKRLIFKWYLILPV